MCLGARSDRFGEFGEGRSDTEMTVSGLDAQPVVPAAQVLYEGMTSNDHPGGRVGLQSPHRPPPRFESTMVALDPVVAVLSLSSVNSVYDLSNESLVRFNPEALESLR